MRVRRILVIGLLLSLSLLSLWGSVEAFRLVWKQRWQLSLLLVPPLLLLTGVVFWLLDDFHAAWSDP